MPARTEAGTADPGPPLAAAAPACKPALFDSLGAPGPAPASTALPLGAAASPRTGPPVRATRRSAGTRIVSSPSRCDLSAIRPRALCRGAPHVRTVTLAGFPQTGRVCRSVFHGQSGRRSSADGGVPRQSLRSGRTLLHTPFPAQVRSRGRTPLVWFSPSFVCRSHSHVAGAGNRGWPPVRAAASLQSRDTLAQRDGKHGTGASRVPGRTPALAALAFGGT